MKKLITMELEGLPPTVNHSYEKRGNRLYKTRRCRDYQAIVSEKLRQAWGNRDAYTGTIELRIKFETKDNRRWDIDNRVKALQDCLMQSGLIKDDSQIRILHVERKHGDSDRTRIEVKTNGSYKRARLSGGIKILEHKVRSGGLADQTERRLRQGKKTLRGNTSKRYRTGSADDITEVE